MSPVKKFSISLSPAVVAEIETRGKFEDEGRSGKINKALERYFAGIENTRRKLADQLSAGEIGLILDALNGTMFADTFSIAWVENEIKDAISMDHLDKKWKIDGPQLVAKLTALTYPEKAALVDIVERWWDRIGSGKQPQPQPIDALKRAQKEI